MDEIALSNNLTVIEQEIYSFHELGSRSIWEIGKRLNYVKEKDLAHGEFGLWLQKIGMNHNTANRYMKINKELNYDSSQNLGFQNLYHIALIPEEERNKQHKTSKGETKTPDEMTVKEIKELNKQLKEKDEVIKQLDDQIKNQKPEVVEKVVEKSVTPPDYKDLKGDNKELSQMLKQAQSEAETAKDRNEFVEQQYQELLEQRKEVNEKSQKYDELTKAIENAEGEMDSYQEKISAYKNISDTIRKGNELLDVLSGLIYASEFSFLNEDNYTSEKLRDLVVRVNRWSSDIENKLDQPNILEGEIIND